MFDDEVGNVKKHYRFEQADEVVYTKLFTVP